MSQPLLSQLNLVTRDMESTLSFYRLLWLDIPDSKVWRTETGAHRVDLTLPNGFGLDFDSPALAQVYNASWNRPEGSLSVGVIGFTLDTRTAVDATYAQRVAAGHDGLQPPFDAFWGARYAIVEDPNGNHVGLMRPIDPARRSAGPELQLNV